MCKFPLLAQEVEGNGCTPNSGFKPVFHLIFCPGEESILLLSPRKFVTFPSLTNFFSK